MDFLSKLYGYFEEPGNGSYTYEVSEESWRTL